MLLKAMTKSEHRKHSFTSLEKLEIEKETLLSELIKVAQLANLNAMEIIHWSLLLDNCRWEDSGSNYRKFLRITALQIKVYIIYYLRHF
jgi:hypothetical protein